MKILVTGVTGRVGRNLSAALLARGDTVRGLVLPGDPGLGSAQAAGIECLVGNLRDAEVGAEAVAGVDAIFHLGAMMLWGDFEQNAVLFEDNVRGTFNLLNAAAARATDLKRFVFASSDEVYPSLSAEYLPIDEDHPTKPYSFYGTSKLIGENLAFYYHRAISLPATVARFALVTEPPEVTRPDGWLGRFLFVESMIGTARAIGGTEAAATLEGLQVDPKTLLLARDAGGTPYMFHYCDVRDLVQGLLLLLDHPDAVGEAFNLSGPVPFTYDLAIPYLSEKSGIPFVEVNIPGPPIRIQHSIAKAQTVLGYRPQYDFHGTVDAALAAGDVKR
ncbi:MAG: NAD(P)-dependent oxidoreductase [Trueperaceae bacterium]|nr:MAG: NAD(P)-dependent oxidoreductase [Trueperaceae bacterium]